MNKKMMLIGSLVLILAMGLVFTGCKNDDDGGVVVGFKGSSTPQNVTFEKGGGVDANHNFWVINWIAADDAVDYEIVWQKTNAKTWLREANQGFSYEDTEDFYDNTLGYSNGDGKRPTNAVFYTPNNSGSPEWYDSTETTGKGSTDADLWSAVVEIDNSKLGSVAGDTGKLGVIAVPLYNNDKNLEVVWCDQVITVK